MLVIAIPPTRCSSRDEIHEESMQNSFARFCIRTLFGSGAILARAQMLSYVDEQVLGEQSKKNDWIKIVYKERSDDG